jgi:hypothetical protein
MSFLLTLLILIAGYYLLRLILAWLAPRLFAYVARKAEARFREAFGMPEDRNEDRSGHIGATSVWKKSKNNNKEDEKVGEYIEFEELD